MPRRCCEELWEDANICERKWWLYISNRWCRLATRELRVKYLKREREREKWKKMPKKSNIIVVNAGKILIQALRIKLIATTYAIRLHTHQLDVYAPSSVVCGKIVILFRKSTNLFNWTWIYTRSHIHKTTWMCVAFHFVEIPDERQRPKTERRRHHCYAFHIDSVRLYENLLWLWWLFLLLSSLYFIFICCCWFSLLFALWLVRVIWMSNAWILSFLLCMSCICVWVSVALYEYASTLSQSHSWTISCSFYCIVL